MSVYMTEEEQIEAIKSWWKRNGNVVTTIFSAVLIVFSAYRYWSWHQEKMLNQASNTYEHMMLAFSNHDNKAVRGYAKQLIEEYDDTVYANVARLTLAKLLVVKGDYKKAITLFEEVESDAKVTALKQVASIRKARLLIDQKHYKKALNVLKRVDDPAYLSVIEELQGDVYAATGHERDALTYYKKAISSIQKQGVTNPFLDMKASQLAALVDSKRTQSSKQVTV